MSSPARTARNSESTGRASASSRSSRPRLTRMCNGAATRVAGSQAQRWPWPRVHHARRAVKDMCRNEPSAYRFSKGSSRDRMSGTRVACPERPDVHIICMPALQICTLSQHRGRHTERAQDAATTRCESEAPDDNLQQTHSNEPDPHRRVPSLLAQPAPVGHTPELPTPRGNRRAPRISSGATAMAPRSPRSC